MSQGTDRRLVPTRQRELLALLRTNGTGHVDELARILEVSPSTVRRDLNDLSQRGLLERVHGGAAALENSAEPVPFVRAEARLEEKTRIGRAAAALVEDHSTIVVSGGTTTEAMVGFLAGKTGVTILTNSLLIVHQAARLENVNVVVLGGVLRRSEMSMLGSLTVEGLKEFGIDLVLTGAFGVDPQIGLSGVNLRETQTDRSLVQSGGKLIVLADSTKIRKRGAVRLASPEDIDLLITDSDADQADLDAFRASGIAVAIA